MDILTTRLVDVVGARIDVRSSYLQQWPTVAWIRVKALKIASPVLLPLSYPTIP